MKKCPKCSEIKDEVFFSNDIRKKDGKFGLCKECTYLVQFIHNQTPKGRYTIIKKGAKRRGYTFLLTMEDFMKFWNTDCYYCGEKVEGIGLDRMNNSIGYELGNVVQCCHQCNMMKHTYSKDSFISQCIKIADRNR